MTLTDNDKRVLKPLGEKTLAWAEPVLEKMPELPMTDLESAALIDGEVVPCNFIIACLWRFENRDAAVIAKDIIDDAEISTVFLGCGSRHFETMVFGNDLRYQRHAKTIDEARKMHERACHWVRQGGKQGK